MCNLYSITRGQEAMRRLFRVARDLTGNLPALPAVYPDTMAPVVRVARDGERELTMMRWGFPPPPNRGAVPITNVRNVKSPYWRGSLKTEWRCLVPATSFCEWSDSRPKVTHWFALDESRPLFAFAGIWCLWIGARKGESGRHELFAFLTTEANEVVRPVHSKAMPVLLTAAEDWDTWRQSWKVMYPLREVLLLVVCGTIASGDDYDDIVDWGQARLSFLRRFSEFHDGIPCADWLRTVMNRIDPELFAACFSSWVAACWPDKPDLVAIDGKTSRRSHDRKRGQKPLHLVSAFATRSRLVLGQEAVEEKSNEITAIQALLERIDLEGSLVSIDAMGCNPNIAQSILDAKADYLLAVKDNQPTLHADVKSYFDTAPAAEVERCDTLGKEHGRLEMRTHAVSHTVDWIASQRSYPGAPRFPKIVTIAMVESRIERGDKIESERRSYISSRALSAAAFAEAVRSHWAIKNNLHWTLDVTFREDQSRLRAGHGARNMAVVRHFALNLVRQASDKRSIKRRRKRASWDPEYLFNILELIPR